jgi:hypothetical protein
MAMYTTQRFLTGLEVFDTYKGSAGTIMMADLDTTSVPSLAPLYTGTYFIVQFTDTTRQVFTAEGKRVDHTTGIPTLGVTLLTNPEYVAVLSAGYPS